MTQELIDRARELLNSIQYINVASVTPKGLPWNTPLYAKFDEELNFYWASWIHADHSINIRSHGDVFVTLYDSTRKRGDNNRRCLYLSGTAKELDKVSEIAAKLKLLYGEEALAMSVDAYSGSAFKRLYCFSPTATWLNDLSERQVTGTTVKMRIEVPLDKLVNSLRAVSPL